MLFSRKAGSSKRGLGFDLVRRGYDCAQVDAYVEGLSQAAVPVGPPAFDVARRGYDRQQVDAHVAELLAGRGSGA
ncbi:hypothetical protein ACFU90_24625 [Streptomyces noursei]|uniref:hypothetical protein n=1 Tax=Streptomyces noursei TaxID=1971 RepID=UPI0005C809CE|nr:hypothetical protein [Streptomyces noursei]